MDKHPFVLRELDGRTIEIDEGIVDVIDSLWAAGIRTAHCCQGNPDQDGIQHPGYVDIIFDDFFKFMELIDNDYRGLFEVCHAIDVWKGHRLVSHRPETVAIHFHNEDLDRFSDFILSRVRR